MANPQDLFTTWGREFCIAVAAIHDDCCEQDGYEAYFRAFGRPPDIAFMRAMTDEQLGRLRDAAREVLEAPAVELAHMRAAVEATLWHVSP